MNFIADVYSRGMLKVAADDSLVASSERHNQLASRLALGESPGVLGKTLKDETCKHSWTCAIAELEAAGHYMVLLSELDVPGPSNAIKSIVFGQQTDVLYRLVWCADVVLKMTIGIFCSETMARYTKVVI